MIRPLMSQSIDDLESLYRTSSGDRKVLERLKLELSYRKTPRAVTLLQKVERALKNTDCEQSEAGGQRELDIPQFVPPRRPARDATPEPVITPLIKPVGDWCPMSEALPKETPTVGSSENAILRQPASVMDKGQAARILGVSPNAAWDVIEAARRKLVMRAHPSNTRQLDSVAKEHALSEARQVNTACSALAASRLIRA